MEINSFSENNFTVSPVSVLRNTQFLARVSLHRMVLPAVMVSMMEHVLYENGKRRDEGNSERL